MRDASSSSRQSLASVRYLSFLTTSTSWVEICRRPKTERTRLLDYHCLQQQRQRVPSRPSQQDTTTLFPLNPKSEKCPPVIPPQFFSRPSWADRQLFSQSTSPTQSNSSNLASKWTTWESSKHARIHSRTKDSPHSGRWGEICICWWVFYANRLFATKNGIANSHHLPFSSCVFSFSILCWPGTTMGLLPRRKVRKLFEINMFVSDGRHRVLILFVVNFCLSQSICRQLHCDSSWRWVLS